MLLLTSQNYDGSKYEYAYTHNLKNNYGIRGTLTYPNTARSYTGH